MVRSFCLVACCAMVVLLTVPTEAYPRPAYYYRNAQYDPEQIVDMLTSLENVLQLERKLETLNEDISRWEKPSVYSKPSSDKRGLDLGLNRGFSGSVQAKHLLGMAAAADASGPGRRRRNAN